MKFPLGKIRIYLVFLLIVFLFYSGLIKSHYQQDEWHAAGRIMTEGHGYLFSEFSLLGNILLESRPFARFLNLIFFGQFALNTIPLFLFVVLAHSLNSFLVYLITLKLIRKSFISFLATLFFVLNDTSKQAVLWYGTATGTLPSTTGILLSALFYLYFLERRRKKFAILSILFFAFSLGFKETGIFLFLFLPFLDFAYQLYQRKKIRYWKFPSSILLAGIVFIGFKVTNILFLAPAYVGYISGAGGTKFRILWAVVTYPIETVSQLFIPDRFFYPFSLKTTFSIFPYFEKVGYAVQVSEKLVLEILSILATTIFFIPLLILTLSKKNKFPLIFSALFYLLSFIPYIAIVKSSAYLESRYYYTLAIPLVIFFAVLMENILFYLKKFISKKLLFSAKTAFTSLFILFLLIHVKYINQQIQLQKEKAELQKPILEYIYESKQSLSKKQIFYITSDRSFIMEGNPLPFQQGIGYTVLVYYLGQGGDKNFRQFLSNNYFWEIENRGYKEKSGYGFGFYSDLPSLKRDIKKYKLNPNSVEAFYYDSVSKKMKDISKEVRKKIAYE